MDDTMDTGRTYFLTVKCNFPMYTIDSVLKMLRFFWYTAGKMKRSWTFAGPSAAAIPAYMVDLLQMI